MPTTKTFDIVPASLAVKAMRDNGYKTTAHAVAELIDNSAQAGATLIELFCVEEAGLVEQRSRHRITEVAVLDNGSGMDPETLRIALQFGNGTHLNDREGIGRFGMGLPTASLSQCQRVDVWTWQSGPDNAMHSYLDYADVMNGRLTEVPSPESEAVPRRWRRLSKQSLGPSGTVVVWSNLDRVTWRGAAATLENTEFLIGRMYRKLVHEGRVIVRLAAVRGEQVDWEMNARVNDPLYLMAPSSTPGPFDTRPMFRPWGETGEEKFTVDFAGQRHEVLVRLSYATDEARLPADGTDPGSKDYGKHAKKNVGVSIVRAGRELDIDQSWSIHDLRERWWGAEVDFPPSLDEVFGVTNNKQAATHFTEMAAFFMDEARADDWLEVKELWKEEGDPRVYLLEIANYLATQLNQIRLALRQQTVGRRGPKPERHEAGVEDRATAKIKERIKAGDRADIVDDAVDPETLRQNVAKDLERKGIPDQTAQAIADAVVERDRKVVFVPSPDDSDAFFIPRPLPGLTELVLNMNHPAYDQLVATLEPEGAVESAQEFQQRLQTASETLRMLLCAWARYEFEERAGSRRDAVASARKEWGKMARLFLADTEVDA